MRTFAMRLLWFILISMFFETYARDFNFGSYELNQVELTPLHDAIIFNDIADIINELDNNMNPSQNKYIFSNNDSGEDVEELLSEYQHYLDKAHKQRIDYEEKSKGKNKVPLIRREKYIKGKDSTRSKYEVSKDYLNTIKYFQTFSNPFNLFALHNEKGSMDNGHEFTDVTSEPQSYKKVITNLFPSILRSNQERLTSSCYCRVDQIPCKCNCKQCIVSTDLLPNINFKNHNNDMNLFIENHIKHAKYTQNKAVDDKFNIRIKIDVELPKLSELGYWLHNSQIQDKLTDGEWLPSKETVSTINLPFPYLNLPFPMELLGDSKMHNRHDSSIRKITVHKKKKSRFGSTNKKQMGKKVISFNSFKLDQPIEYKYIDNNHNVTENGKNNSINSYNKDIEETSVQTIKSENVEMFKNYTTNNTIEVLPFKNVNSSIDTILLTVNISKKGNNDTNESLKLENSIETDFVDKDKKSSNEPIRLKREAAAVANTNKTLDNHTKEHKMFDKTGELELLYWPAANKNITLVKSQNITALILERENKKAKLNMTYDKIRSNRSKALEQAIFGEVDWNDVDTVAPVFMSFVGKYIKGVLTFCSQSICHSMKCAEKTCLHRICLPDNRLNHKGHCTGNNDTDSIAAMESIMDLPSNIVFEIVDILQDKMLGKMYGKATLCIISKCSTFLASKKLFQKSKCIYKELSSSGHCPIVKNIKMI